MVQNDDVNLSISNLGECRITSPMSRVRFVDDAESVVYHADIREIKALLEAGKEPPCFEMAGPREKIYFDPSKLKCGIVTCGGLCPGVNDVIRAIVMGLHYLYGAQTVFGFRYGLPPCWSKRPLVWPQLSWPKRPSLFWVSVRRIHQVGERFSTRG